MPRRPDDYAIVHFVTCETLVGIVLERHLDHMLGNTLYGLDRLEHSLGGFVTWRVNDSPFKFLVEPRVLRREDSKPEHVADVRVSDLLALFLEEVCVQAHALPHGFKL